MTGPDDLLVDDFAARSKNIAVDSTYRLLDHDFHVAGIVEHGKGARIFVPMQTLAGSFRRPRQSLDLFPEVHPRRTYRRGDGRDARHLAGL